MIYTKENFGYLNAHVVYPNGFTKSKKYPVILFLHGIGERGDDLDCILNYGPLDKCRHGDELPFIIVAPQCKNDEFWVDEMPYLKELINNISKRKYVDKDNMFLTGLSMGGFGCWELLMYMPHTFKKAVIFCGGGFSLRAGEIIDIPVWNFHGDQDTTIPIAKSIEMVESMKKNHRDIKFTICEGVGHACWVKPYLDNEIYDWMLI